MQVPSLESRIASLVHTHFDALPKRSKPTIRSNGTREWIPMSGIVLVLSMYCPCLLLSEAAGIRLKPTLPMIAYIRCLKI